MRSPKLWKPSVPAISISLREGSKKYANMRDYGQTKGTILGPKTPVISFLKLFAVNVIILITYTIKSMIN